MTTPQTDCPIVNSWFTNKETYLAWRAAWKKAYAQLAEEIREHKRDMRDKDPMVRAGGQWRRHAARKKAAYMIEVRKNSKIEAQRQYLAAKALSTPAAA